MVRGSGMHFEFTQRSLFDLCRRCRHTFLSDFYRRRPTMTESSSTSLFQNLFSTTPSLWPLTSSSRQWPSTSSSTVLSLRSSPTTTDNDKILFDLPLPKFILVDTLASTVDFLFQTAAIDILFNLPLPLLSDLNEDLPLSTSTPSFRQQPL